MKASPPASRRWDLAWLVATWFGCGLSPVAPGTAGSLGALAIAIAAHFAFGSGQLTFAVLAAILLFPGIWAADVIAKREEKEDPGLVVVDEVIGQWITLA
ncbi:MAG TPA: phosphatidylglycerophosphatase A, partial [Bryobacteraceae bacterium]|nr:phosphatidylglycerophosphatase A [Bryobacteraceae bacterium]